jgi:hypothetical protein
VRQGASRHALAERGDDLYETPAICVHAAHRAGVFGHATFPGSAGQVWEPCAGRGAISRELRKLGYGVIAQDLVPHPGADPDITPGIDFEMERAAPPLAACIITNPPFKRADQFIRHGLTLVPHVIVLLRAMAIEGAGCSDLIDRHLIAYYIGIDRPPAMHREGWAGNRLTNSGAPFAWFVFQRAPRPDGAPIHLRRFWWDESKRPATMGGGV